MAARPVPRRVRLTAVLAIAAASAAPAVGGGPAAAMEAPRASDPGVDMGIDELGLQELDDIDGIDIGGPDIGEIEAELEAYAHVAVAENAIDHTIIEDPDWVTGNLDLDLTFDLVPAGSKGFPEGGFELRADLTDVVMRFYRYGEWWQPECSFRVSADDSWIEVVARADSSLTLGAPYVVDPATADWGGDLDLTIDVGNLICRGYLVDGWEDDLWGDGTDVAADLTAAVEAAAHDLADDLWGHLP